MPGELTDKQKASGFFSELLEIDVAPFGHKKLRCFVMAPKVQEQLQPLPTILAVSGEEQLHASLFFRAWRAERRGWQVIVAARESKDTPYLMDKPGLDLLAMLTKNILKGQSPVIHPVEGARLHLVGTSNGGASVLALAARKPDQIASVSLVTGYVPECLKDFGPLGRVPRIRLMGSKQDRNNLQDVLDQLELVRAPVDGLHIVSGANHTNVGEKLDMESFWSWLEASRPEAGRATKATRAAAADPFRGCAKPAADAAAAAPAAEATPPKSAIVATPAVQVESDPAIAAADMQEVLQSIASASSAPSMAASAIEATAEACAGTLEKCPTSDLGLAALADGVEDRGEPSASASSG
mmetsp:Transcript_147903/g.411942  ORF Transcript_147903/g.411942 Transcript_147903/m.411942 type:complete len:354 (+) Transcript_147903:95-1156(+)|eukprot:CAMPEP_0179055350 /NCGR_PEP_ID=MMETSP0796-20121207/23254_1 /TAXON_ID=73915 /ORGANISM="Pyrodinium bahamense, Strain pbaha01" /LENGTH=353 /DNA_ID=CAMNT_0020751997 /DNA_START=70 /DNA_END=1131 /DNA_ORIENTATION=+